MVLISNNVRFFKLILYAEKRIIEKNALAHKWHIGNIDLYKIIVS